MRNGRLTAYIEGIGLLGPGLGAWASSAAVVSGESVYEMQPTVLTAPESLPPAERRRVGRVVKLALDVGLQATTQAGTPPGSLAAVFSSSGGDGYNCHEICQALVSDRQLSPTRFHNSVHNAAAGYWSIATGAQQPSNSLGGYDWSFGVGLLEAQVQVVVEHRRVLLVAYDAQYLPPLFAKRPIPDAFAVAFVLAPERSSAALARMDVCLSDSPPEKMPEAGLEQLRASIPAARSLPLLRQLARKAAARVNVEYLDGRSLEVEIAPCR